MSAATDVASTFCITVLLCSALIAAIQPTQKGIGGAPVSACNGSITVPRKIKEVSSESSPSPSFARMSSQQGCNYPPRLLTFPFTENHSASHSPNIMLRRVVARRHESMSKVRVLVGTHKGAFILTSDGKRQQWDVSGPHFAGWEVYHLKGSPADTNRIYCAPSTGWHGQVIQRSDDGGKTWEPVGNKFSYEGTTGTHMWYDGTPHPWEFK